MPFKFSPFTGTLDIVSDLSNYAQLSVPITATDLSTAIANSTLIPEQWYLITDYQTVAPIEGDPAQELYTGAVEQIYVQASGVNTIYPIGHSKDHPDEEITYKANVPPITENFQAATYGGDINCFWENGVSATEVDGYKEITILGSTSISIPWTPQNNIDFGNDMSSFSAQLDDSAGGVYAELYESNYGDDWQVYYDVEAGVLEIEILDGASAYLSNGFTFDSFTAEGSMALYFASGTLYQSGAVKFEIVSATEIKFTTYQAEFGARLLDGSFYLDFGDGYAVGGALNDDNYGEWTYDSETGILNVDVDASEGIDMTFVNGNTYMYTSFDNVLFTFNGRIVARRNLVKNTYIEDDYRGRELMRFKALATTWSAGTTTSGTLVRYGTALYMAARDTTSAPTAGTDWVYLCPDQYYFAATLSVGSLPYCTIPYDAAVYQTTTMFDIAAFDAYASPLDIELYRVDATTDLNMFFTQGILSSFDTKIIGYNVTITSEIDNSNVYLTNSVLGNCTRTTIAAGDNILAMTLNGCSFKNLANTYAYSLSFFTISSVTYCVFGLTSTQSTGQTITACLMKLQFDKNTVTYANACQFWMRAEGNFIANLSQSVFYNVCIVNNMFGDMLYNYVWGAFQYNSVYGVFYNNNIGTVSGNTWYNTFARNNKLGTANYDSTQKLNVNFLNNIFYAASWENFGAGAGSLSNNKFVEFQSNEFKTGGTTYISANTCFASFSYNALSETAALSMLNNVFASNCNGNFFKYADVSYNFFFGIFQANTFTTSAAVISYCKLQGNVTNCAISANFKYNNVVNNLTTLTLDASSVYSYHNMVTANGMKPFVANNNLTITNTTAASESIVHVNTGASNKLVYLPPALGQGRILTITKLDSGAGLVVVTADATGTADTIDGAATYSIVGMGNSITLQDYDANVWKIISSYNATGIYSGEPATDGSWRFIPSGNNLSVQRRESGSWVEKSFFTP